MKKSQRILYVMAVVLLAAGLLGSTLLMCYKLQCKEAEQIISDAEYIIGTRENPNSVMKELLDDGYSPFESFYLGYGFQKPDYYLPTGFHSELINGKGEVLAEYKPHIILSGETLDGKEDFRIITFDEECTVLSEYSNGEKHNWGNNKYPFEAISSCSQAMEFQGADVAELKPLEIYGTCDENFVYVEKMVWYERVWYEDAEDDVECKYIYTPNNNKTHNGKVSVQDWINTLKDKKCFVSTTNLPSSYVDNTAINAEAKEICKSLSADYVKADFSSSVLESRKDNKDLETYTIENVEKIGNGLFVTSVFVLHPVDMVPDDTAIPYVIYILFAVALTVFIAIAINRKISKGYVFNMSKDKEKTVSNYIISVLLSVIGVIVFPLLADITSIGRELNGVDMFTVMSAFAVIASFIMGVCEIKPVLKYTYPVVTAVIALVSWAIVPIWDRETALLPGFILVGMAVSLFGILSGLLFGRIKKAIGMRK